MNIAIKFIPPFFDRNSCSRNDVFSPALKTYSIQANSKKTPIIIIVLL